ncbi:MAG TPA: hypothetical protein VGB38_01460 [bacterium]
MASLWDDIKKKVQEGVSVAADKTEEFRKIGKIKVDIIGIKRSLESSYKDLGMAVHEHLSSGKKGDLKQVGPVKDLVSAIDGFRENLSQKEAEIERIKKEAAAKKSAESKDSGSGTKKTG